MLYIRTPGKNGSHMATSITDFVNVPAKLSDLGCLTPESGLALLPLNFETAHSVTELRQASQTSTIRKLLLQEGLPLCDIVAGSQRPPYVKNKSSALIVPALYLSASFLSENSTLVSVALNVISSYVYEAMKHVGIGREVKLEIVIETRKNETYKRISYEGPVEGLETLPASIREACK